MSREPDYYAILGVEPTADAEAIEAAYHGRSLRFRVGQLRHRNEDSSGPTQEALEQAYGILGNPQARAMYDKIHYPDKPPSTTDRRRVPAWLWAFATAWIVAIVVVGCIGIRSRITPDQGAIGQIVQTATVAAAAGNSGITATPPPSVSPTTSANGPTMTVPAALPPTVSATTEGNAATASVVVTAVPPAAASAVATVAPSRTVATAVVPTQTATAAPTATVPPVPTATTPPPPTPEPSSAAVEPTPEPTEEPPSFQPTDRIGTALSVNLRSGPGAGYRSLGLLPTGTQLAATGETAYSGGQLWRRFALRDGRVGWVRDLDVFPVR